MNNFGEILLYYIVEKKCLRKIENMNKKILNAENAVMQLYAWKALYQRGRKICNVHVIVIHAYNRVFIGDESACTIYPRNCLHIVSIKSHISNANVYNDGTK